MSLGTRHAASTISTQQPDHGPSAIRVIPGPDANLEPDQRKSTVEREERGRTPYPASREAVWKTPA